MADKYLSPEKKVNREIVEHNWNWGVGRIPERRARLRRRVKCVFIYLLVLTFQELRERGGNQSQRRKEEQQHSLSSCLWGGCGWQGSRRGNEWPAVIRAHKKFKPSLLLGSRRCHWLWRRRGPGDELGDHRRLCTCRHLNQPWASLTLEQSKPPHDKGKLQISLLTSVMIAHCKRVQISSHFLRGHMFLDIHFQSLLTRTLSVTYIKTNTATLN